jgi:hypothetical protein
MESVFVLKQHEAQEPVTLDLQLTLPTLSFRALKRSLETHLRHTSPIC